MMLNEIGVQELVGIVIYDFNVLVAEMHLARPLAQYVSLDCC